jgi:hypothetical protein
VWGINKNKLDSIGRERGSNQKLTGIWNTSNCFTMLCFTLEGVEDKLNLRAVKDYKLRAVKDYKLRAVKDYKLRAVKDYGRKTMCFE